MTQIMIQVRDLQHQDKNDLEEVWESIDDVNTNINKFKSRVTVILV